MVETDLATNGGESQVLPKYGNGSSRLVFRMKIYIKAMRTALLLIVFAMIVNPVYALRISNVLEVVRVSAVDYNWRSVNLQNSYTNRPVVVCTYALPSTAANEAAVRLRNVAVSGFDVKIQQPEDSPAVTAGDVYCIVAEEGLHTLPDERIFEAHTVLSDGTNGQARGWGVGGLNGAEDVSTAILGTYPPNSQPVVLGQVMTHNDINKPI